MKNEWNELAAYKAQLRAEMEAEYNAKLEEAYQTLSAEMKTLKDELEAQYESKKQQLDGMGAEYEAHVKQEREELGDYESKLSTLEVQLYEEYDKKLKDAREWIVDKVDQYLEFEWEKLLEEGQEEYAARLAEWRKVKPAGDMVAEAVGGEPAETNEYLRQERRKVEARAMRLSVENAKLTECVKAQAKLLCDLGRKYKLLEDCID